MGKTARELVSRLNQLHLVLGWRHRYGSRAQICPASKDALDARIPLAYTPKLSKEKCPALFEYVYESYPDLDGGVYAGTA